MNIGVAGGGIAGLTLATLLGRAGHLVTVYEQAVSPGPVGAGFLLQPSGQSVLGRLGLLDAIARTSWPIRTFRANKSPDRRLATLRYDRRDPRHVALGVERGRLFEILWAAAEEAGVRLVSGTRVTSARESRSGVDLFNDGNRLLGCFDWVAAADGARSTLRAADRPVRPTRLSTHAALWAIGRLGSDPPAELRQEARGTRTLVGLLPTGPRSATFFWGLRADSHSALVEAGWAAFRARVAAVMPEAGPILDSIGGFDSMILTRWGSGLPGRMVRGRLIFLGDAAHPTSPHLGQGANLALLDAECLATAVAEHRDIGAALRAFERLRWPMNARYSMLSRALSPFFQSETPGLGRLRDSVLPAMSAFPPTRALMERVLAGRG